MISKLTTTGTTIVLALFACLTFAACASSEEAVPEVSDAMPAPATYGATHGQRLVVSRCTECHEKLEYWTEHEGGGDVIYYRPTRSHEAWALLLSDATHYNSFEAHERASILAYLTQNG